MEQKTENVGQHFLIGMMANQLMPFVIKGEDIQSSLNNKDAVIKRSINVATVIAKQIQERVGDEDTEVVLTAASSTAETVGAMIEKDPGGTFANLESRTKVAIDMVIELNESVEKLDENVNEEEEQ
ncbi:hypothetical protein KDU71_02435 [Carboxylicivirga sediminis]|uniref:Uncharacterized protein n=1 Tax=Carboxylicivirga sediminis TaxID=2006564 RepID=A0A941IX86_9BACT|nr:hypothetical protein [Carboxylicivirga sediminis]MBR8534402.1 hypothetical protein [Carboxylicivirga sediminis]